MPKVVVCGGGSAGCVVAARLSEDAENEVLLLEAGPDYETVEALPDDVRYAWNIGGLDHDWKYLAEDELVQIETANEIFSSLPDRIQAYRGKVLGGSSATNASNALRPTSQDYERWAGMGNDWWNWEKVLPAFRAMENDPIGGERHGDSGPLPVRRFGEDEIRPLYKAFIESAQRLGWPYEPDLNGVDTGGVGPTPFNQVDRVRMSTAITYIDPARERDNLTIRPDTVVDRVEFEGGAARRVVLEGGEVLEADTVVLCSGALSSPGILMRSGIGPAELLGRLEIPLLVEAEAVGKNLRDHGMVFMTVALNEKAGSPEPPIQASLVFNAAGAAAQAAGAEPDLHLIPVSPTADLLILSVGVVQPHSLGHFEIASRDVAVDPKITLGVLTHPEDLARVVNGIKIVRELVATEPLADFVSAETWPGPAIETDAQLTEAVRGGKSTYSHATSTCAMGPVGAGVVDQRGKVHGVEDLYVVDASIFPMIPSSPTNLPTIMLAERCAGALRESLSARSAQRLATGL